MKPSSWWPVRWGMAFWIALAAADTLFYACMTLAYKLGLFAEHFPYPANIPLIEVTPLWDPVLAFVAGVMFLFGTVLILRRSRIAFVAVVAPCTTLLLLFSLRLSRPDSGYLQSLSMAYHKSQYFLIAPIAGLAVTMLICLALWRNSQTPAPP